MVAGRMTDQRPTFSDRRIDWLEIPKSQYGGALSAGSSPHVRESSDSNRAGLSLNPLRRGPFRSALPSEHPPDVNLPLAGPPRGGDERR